MLTQDQLKQLEPLTKHPKYGKLLSDAIEVWKHRDVTPVYGCFGIIDEQEYFEFINSNDKFCCLLGASLIGYKINKTLKNKCKIYNALTEKYSLSDSEIHNIWHGFDDTANNYNAEAYSFGNDIRKIVLPLEKA